jgi:uncharacterized protein DUF4157
MEQRFGRDFSRVRIHTGAEASATARALQAAALTHGTDILFAAGSYAPGTSRGRELLAHELTHVVQQERSGTTGEPRASEREAVRNSKLVHQTPVRVLPVATAATGIQRQAGSAQTASTGPPVLLPAYDARLNVPSGMHGRFNASFDRRQCSLALRVLVRPEFTQQQYPGDPLNEPWAKGEAEQWTNSFVASVERRWGSKVDLVRQGNCPGEPCARVNTKVFAVPVTSGEHFFLQVQHTRVPLTPKTGAGIVTGLTSEYIKPRRAEGFSQVPVEHEFGHMIGTPEVRSDLPGRQAYGITPQEKADIMGLGSALSIGDFKPFLDAIREFSACSWRLEFSQSLKAGRAEAPSPSPPEQERTV